MVCAVKKKEKIAIFGDFDADGITSTVVMVELLEKMNHRDVAVYTPDRFKRGEYGLTFAVAEKIIQGGSRLLIIIDSGMNNHAQIEAVAQKGIEVIIIDHHQVISGRPRAIAVVNPYQSGEQYPFKDLSSCGLVLKLSQALLDTISVPFVELAAIAAVADRVPLLKENRVITKIGGTSIEGTTRLGLKELMRLSNESLEALAQRINCASELYDTNNAFELLTTDDPGLAERLARELSNEYWSRDGKFKEALVIAREQVEHLAGGHNVVFIGHEKYDPELRGMIAGRLRSADRRPIFVYTDSGDRLRGTARSSERFNLVTMLSRCGQYMDNFGGHPQAVGFDVKRQNLESLRTCLLDQEKEISGEMLKPEIAIDAQISDIDRASLDYLEAFKPYGSGNPTPVILFNVKIDAKA